MSLGADRGSGGPRIHHHLFLAHHRLEDLDRCVLLPLMGGRLAICARCLGLYPTLVGVLALQFLLGPGPRGRLDWVIALVGIFPALLDFGASFLGTWRGANALRVVTGALLGVALGRSLMLYIVDARSEIFWVQVGLLGAGLFAFLVVKRIQPLG